MTHTHSVIMWHNQDGTTTLSQRYASGYIEPKPENAPPRVATIVKPSTLVVSSTEYYVVQADFEQLYFVRTFQPTLLHMPSRSLPTTHFYKAKALANHWYSLIP